MPEEQVPERARELAAKLADPRPMRRGSVSERSMKCGKMGCRCQHDPQARHGPYHSLTRARGGKTQSRYLSAEQAEVARQQIEAGQEFRRDVEAYWDACERWGDMLLEASEAAAQRAAGKGGSRRPSKEKSSPRSRRSLARAPSTSGTSRP